MHLWSIPTFLHASPKFYIYRTKPDETSTISFVELNCKLLTWRPSDLMWTWSSNVLTHQFVVNKTKHIFLYFGMVQKKKGGDLWNSTLIAQNYIYNVLSINVWRCSEYHGCPYILRITKLMLKCRTTSSLNLDTIPLISSSAINNLLLYCLLISIRIITIISTGG